MRRIKKRRNKLRINNPIGFSLFCILCLAVLAGLVVGVYYLIEYGPGACAAVSEYFEKANATAEPTASPTIRPTQAPTAEPENQNTPYVGELNSPEPPPSSAPLTSAPPASNAPNPSGPLWGITVGIDPFRDGQSKYSAEAEYNLEFAQKLKEYLEQRGAVVVLTRTENEGSYSDSERAKVINENNCTVAIRLLCNHLSSKGVNGCYVQATAKNRELAQSIVDAYVASTGLETRKENGYEKKNVAFFKSTDCPSLNLIIGHWTNKSELEKLNDEAFQQLMMEGIYNGLLNGLGLNNAVMP